MRATSATLVPWTICTTVGKPALRPSRDLLEVVRTSSERAAAPSLYGSWGSGSRPSGSRDHLGLCDPHNRGAMFVRDAGEVRAAPERPPAAGEDACRGDCRDPCSWRERGADRREVASCFARITGSAGSSSGPRPMSSPARLTRCRRAEVARRAFGCRRSSGLAQSPTGTVVRRVSHERDGSLARRSPGRRRLPHCLSIRWSGRRELDRWRGSADASGSAAFARTLAPSRDRQCGGARGSGSMGTALLALRVEA